MTALNAAPFAGTPTIETDRLVLRPFRTEDREPFHALLAHDQIKRFTGNHDRNHQQVWFMLLRRIGHWHLMGYGYWVITDKATGLFLGEAGLQEAMRDIRPSITGKPEAGWSIRPDRQGEGLATEALGTVFNWADEHMPSLPLTALIEPENSPSLKLAARFGFTHRADSLMDGTPIGIFERAPKT